jgi:NAD(P)H-hydrate epimerase
VDLKHSEAGLKDARRFDQAAARAVLPARAESQHKKRAVVLLVAGSAQYLGAALLCARGAYRTGAGMVRLVLPEPLAVGAMAAFPELVVHGLGSSPFLGPGQVSEVEALAAQAHALVVGPGLGREPETRALIQRLWSHTPQTAVFDADALASLDLEQRPGGARVLTPHEGELVALLGPQALQAGRPSAARLLALKSHSVALLKGPATLVARPDATLSVNTTGSPVLATAGSGDVLAGCIAALIAQGADPYDAACVGAWIHGWAGEHWASEHAHRGLLASDLADLLPLALAQIGG